MSEDKKPKKKNCVIIQFGKNKLLQNIYKRVKI